MKKNYLLWIFLLALFLRLIFLDTSYFIWDETVYIMNSQYLATGDAPYVQFYERPLFVSLLILPFFRSEIFMRVLMVVLNSLSVFGIYHFGRNLNEKTGLISAFFVAIMPFHILTSRWVMTDTLSFLFIVLCIGFYIKGIKGKSLFDYLLGGVFFGLSLLLKFTNILLLGVLFGLFVFLHPEIRKVVYSFIIAFAAFFPYLWFNYLYFGDMFYPIIQAMHVVKESQPISFFIVFWQIFLFFGLMIIFAFVEIFTGKEKDNLFGFMIFWLVFGLAYFVLLSQKGIAKLPGIEWEMQRFIFPALAPGVVLGAMFLSKLNNKRLISFFAFMILIFIPSYMIAYTPAIAFEDGLRFATKEAGMELRDDYGNIGVYAITNFPSIAYYSGKKTSNKIEDLYGMDIYSLELEQGKYTITPFSLP